MVSNAKIDSTPSLRFSCAPLMTGPMMSAVSFTVRLYSPAATPRLVTLATSRKAPATVSSTTGVPSPPRVAERAMAAARCFSVTVIHARPSVSSYWRTVAPVSEMSRRSERSESQILSRLMGCQLVSPSTGSPSRSTLGNVEMLCSVPCGVVSSVSVP